LKAQAIQESSLNPAAVSPVGAAGLMQFMPGTWADVSRQLGWRNIDPRSPQHSIIAGAFYMRQLRAMWSRRERTAIEQNDLAQASYNGGPGSVLAAQRKCGDARLWPEISPCLAWITGRKNAAETIGYVRNIAKWRSLLQ
jgi:soluble lytic murein transglycosylase-like protein